MCELAQQKTYLDAHIEKLSAFTDTNSFAALHIIDKSLIRSQVEYMRSYSEMLQARIERL